MPVATQKQAKIIEPSHKSLQFDAVDQENGHRGLGLAHMVEESVLKILRFFARHELILLILGRRGRPYIVLVAQRPSLRRAARRYLAVRSSLASGARQSFAPR